MTLCEKICLVCLMVFGLFFILLSIVALTLIGGLVDKTMLSRDRLGYEDLNGTRRLNPMTEKWVHPEYHMQVQIWMFNLTNHAGSSSWSKTKGARDRTVYIPVRFQRFPTNIAQRHPFLFRERQYKSPYQFDKNDTRVFYRNNHVYTFNESLSCASCSLDKHVIIPNVIFQKLVDFAQHGFAAKFAIEAVLTVYKRESPFIEVSVKEALYDGYKDPLLAAVCDKTPFLKALCVGAKIPDRIGFFYGQNNTDDGLYEVDTGRNDVYNIGKVFF
ncbi:hypothetical protein COOONC_10966 [Cooperia oncophora]